MSVDRETAGNTQELTPRELRTLRFLGVGAAIAAVVIGIAHRLVNPDLVDPLWERATISVTFLALVATSFVYTSVRFMRLVYAAFYLTTFWILHLLSLNSLAPDYAISLVLRDLSEEKQAQQDTIRASRLAAIGELAAGVAHEVNNPLAAISGFAQLTLAESDARAFHDDLRAIVSEAQRAGSIIRNLLAFARLNVAEKKPTQLTTVVARVLELKRFQLAEANIQLNTDFEADLPAVLADENQLLQVVDNVITNARQAIQETGRPGRIDVRLRRSETSVELVVEDTGPGIPADQLPRMFTPFYTTKGVGEGTGLGLSIVYGIVREHGGVVTAGNWGTPVTESGPPGHGGARLCIRLPMTDRAIQTEEVQVLKEDDKESATGLRVLIVEDEAMIARLVRRHLERGGHIVVAASCAEDAVAIIEAGDTFDVVISDIRMPGMGGEGLFRYLREHRPDLAQRLIFTSGDIVSPDTHRFLEESGRPALPKPFNLSDLNAQLHAVLEENR